jgi:hypothetical protein
MVSCAMRTPRGTSKQTTPAVAMSGATEDTPDPNFIPRPDNLRRPQDLLLEDRGHDYHLLADLFNYDWHVDADDFQHDEGNLGPD